MYLKTRVHTLIFKLRLKGFYFMQLFPHRIINRPVCPDQLSGLMLLLLQGVQ